MAAKGSRGGKRMEGELTVGLRFLFGVTKTFRNYTPVMVAHCEFSKNH